MSARILQAVIPQTVRNCADSGVMKVNNSSVHLVCPVFSHDVTAWSVREPAYEETQYEYRVLAVGVVPSHCFNSAVLSLL
jgi:hypothetical protein